MKSERGLGTLLAVEPQRRTLFNLPGPKQWRPRGNLSVITERAQCERRWRAALVPAPWRSPPPQVAAGGCFVEPSASLEHSRPVFFSAGKSLHPSYRHRTRFSLGALQVEQGSTSHLVCHTQIFIHSLRSSSQVLSCLRGGSEVNCQLNFILVFPIFGTWTGRFC